MTPGIPVMERDTILPHSEAYGGDWGVLPGPGLTSSRVQIAPDVGVTVAVGVSVAVGATVGVGVGVPVGVGVLEGVGVCVGGMGVGVGVGVALRVMRKR